MPETIPVNAGRISFGSGVGLTVVSAAGEHLFPDLPDMFWVVCFCVGLALIIVPIGLAAREWISDRWGGFIATSVLGVAGLLIFGAVGGLLYERENYSLQYQVCFNHDHINDPVQGPLVTAIDVAPRLITTNAFDIPTNLVRHDLFIKSGDGPAFGSLDDQKVRPLTAKANDDSGGFPDYVEFKPPQKPASYTGEAIYVFQYGRSVLSPMSRTLTIKGTIVGAISPDGRQGGFYFTPDNDNGGAYIPKICVVPKSAYYVENKR